MYPIIPLMSRCQKNRLDSLDKTVNNLDQRVKGLNNEMQSLKTSDSTRLPTSMALLILGLPLLLFLGFLLNQLQKMRDELKILRENLSNVQESNPIPTPPVEIDKIIDNALKNNQTEDSLKALIQQVISSQEPEKSNSKPMI